MRNVFVLDERIPLLAEWLATYGDVHRVEGRSLTADMLRDWKATVLIVRGTTRVGASLIDGTNLHTVCTATAGVDHIDTQLLRERSITFFHAPGSNADAVVEYVLAAIERFRGYHGQTLGVVGYGNVGSRLAAAATRKGLSVLVSDPPLVEQGGLSAAESTPLMALLEASDIISLHVPLTHRGPHATHYLLNADTMRHIRDGALLINSSRGGVVEEDALDGRFDVVLDVFEDEPLLREHTVRIATHITPHIAGYTHEAKINGSVMVYQALATHLGLPAVDAAVQSAAHHATHDVVRVSRLDYGLREAWLSDPRPETFDRLRVVPNDPSR